MVVHNPTRWLLIGAGRRIRNDILPALLAMQVSTSRITIVRKSRESIKDFLEIRSFQDIGEAVRHSNPDVIICCVPVEAANEVLSQLRNLDGPHTILFDTPVSQNFATLLELQKKHSVFALEESVLVPWLAQLELLVKKSRFVLFFRSFYEYHGVAVLSRIAETPLVRIWQKFQQGRRFKLFVTNDNRLFCLLGYRNYPKASVFFLGKQLKLLSASRGLELQKVIVRESMKVFQLTTTMNNSEQLNSMYVEAQEKLLFSELAFWKQLALITGLHAIEEQGEILFPSISEMFEFERLSH